MSLPDTAAARLEMVETQIRRRGITDPRVLDAMLSVPRHRFVPDDHQHEAYDDHPIPIDSGQTISQPYIVAYMCECVRIHATDRVLDVGTGSGYNAAVASQLAARVYSVETVTELMRRAEATFRELGYDNIILRHGNGYYGWKEEAPFDAIIVTAAARRIPPPLIEQMAEGGRMIIPLGGHFFTQALTLVEKHGNEIVRQEVMPVRFVPLQGED